MFRKLSVSLLLLLLIVVALGGILIAVTQEKVDTKVLSLRPAAEAVGQAELVAALDLTPIIDGTIEVSNASDAYNVVAALDPLTVEISFDDEMMIAAIERPKSALHHRAIAIAQVELDCAAETPEVVFSAMSATVMVEFVTKPGDNGRSPPSIVAHSVETFFQSAGMKAVLFLPMLIVA